MKHLGYIIGLFLTAILGVGAAQAQSVTLTVDRTSTAVGDPIAVEVKVSGTRNAPEPVIANLSQFDVQSRGTSTQLQIINGKTSAGISHNYVVYPKEVGNYTIGPAVVKIGGKELRSQAVTITVTEEAQKPPKERLYFVKAFVDNKKPFVNEQVVYTFRLFTRVQVANAQLEQPQFRDMWREDIGKQREYEKVINGVNWVVSEFRVALFPTKAGTVTIEPCVLAADFVLKSNNRRSLFDSFFDDPFFGRGRQTKRVRLRTKPVVLQVQSVPQAGRPETFGGLVGHLRIGSSLSKNNLSVGDSATLTISISGNGNLRDAKLPEAVWPAFKVYDDEPSLSVKASGGRIIGTKVFKKALVPTKEGELKIPPLKLSYFDPESEQFKHLASKPYTLSVAPSSEKDMFTHISGSQSAAGKQRVALLGKDIMPIKRSLSALESDTLSPQRKRAILSAVLFLPLLYIGLVLFKRRRDRLLADAGYQVRSGAYRKFIRTAKGFAAAENLYVSISTALRTYLGARLGIDGLSLSPADVVRRITACGVSETCASSIESILKTCESGQYGGGRLDETKQSELIKQVKAVAKDIEKGAKR